MSENGKDFATFFHTLATRNLSKLLLDFGAQKMFALKAHEYPPGPDKFQLWDPLHQEKSYRQIDCQGGLAQRLYFLKLYLSDDPQLCVTKKRRFTVSLRRRRFERSLSRFTFWSEPRHLFLIPESKFEYSPTASHQPPPHPTKAIQ